MDTDFLRRNRLDSNGSLYKAVHWKYSNLRRPDGNKRCPMAPDWNADASWCPEVYRNADPVTGKPNYTDIWSLTCTPVLARRGPGLCTWTAGGVPPPEQRMEGGRWNRWLGARADVRGPLCGCVTKLT